jgi:hypothetical protein
MKEKNFLRRQKTHWEILTLCHSFPSRHRGPTRTPPSLPTIASEPRREPFVIHNDSKSSKWGGKNAFSSKPGERRGGRQRGTPNKKTLLKNAVIAAAVTNPNLSPLEFFLDLMRRGDLPL